MKLADLGDNTDESRLSLRKLTDKDKARMRKYRRAILRLEAAHEE